MANLLCFKAKVRASFSYWADLCLQLRSVHVIYEQTLGARLIILRASLADESKYNK